MVHTGMDADCQQHVINVEFQASEARNGHGASDIVGFFRHTLSRFLEEVPLAVNAAQAIALAVQILWYRV